MCKNEEENQIRRWLRISFVRFANLEVLTARHVLLEFVAPVSQMVYVAIGRAFCELLLPRFRVEGTQVHHSFMSRCTDEPVIRPIVGRA